jgi:hypothetical protein
MCRRTRRVVMTGLLILLTAGCSAEAKDDPAAGKAEADAKAAAGMTEKEKIEHLIAVVEGLKDAVFVRNGEEYDGKAAADHMRTKWKWKEDEIATARDFIRIAASVSSTTGKPYLIRFKDGREVTSGEFLNAELERSEKAPGKGR